MSHVHRRRTLLLLLFAFTLILALAACGTPVGTTGSTSSPAASAPARTTPPIIVPSAIVPLSLTPTSSAPGGPNANPATGCPGKRVMLTPPPAATVVLTADINQRNTAVQRGETVEVRLSSNLSWNGLLQPAQGILALQPPGGALFPAAKACIWSFVAVGRGTATLSFTAHLICQPKQVCPQYILQLFQFVIAVT